MYSPIPEATTEVVNQAAANQAPAENQRANRRPGGDQQIRMNAQGGPVVDDDEENVNRDWLDWVYTFSRFTVLISIVYFYSTLGRFVIVFGLFFLLYM